MDDSKDHISYPTRAFTLLQDYIRSFGRMPASSAPRRSASTSPTRSFKTSAAYSPFSGFLKLPQEMIDSIVLYMSREELSSLSMTCKPIRYKTLGALYHNITMEWVGEVELGPTIRYNPIKSPRIDLLLRTILEKPKIKVLGEDSEYAKWVSVVDFRTVGYHVCTFDFETNWPAPSRRDVEVFKSALSNIKTEAREMFSKALEANSLGAFITLFLVVCSELKAVTLGIELVKDNNFFPHVWSTTLFAPRFVPPLRNLVSVNMGAFRQETVSIKTARMHLLPWRRLYLETYLLFFSIPTLQEAEMNLSDYKRTQQLPISIPGTATALKTLRLPQAQASPQFLGEVLSRTPSLETLMLDLWVYEDTKFSLHALASSLDFVANTITRLSIGLKAWGDTVSIYDARDQSWLWGNCSFRTFTALQILETPPFVLLGWDCRSAPQLSHVLPPNLVAIGFRDDCCGYLSYQWHEELMPVFATFISNRSWMEATPYLQHFNVVLHNDRLFCDNEWRYDKGKVELKVLCEENGLRCDVVQAGDSY